MIRLGDISFGLLCQTYKYANQAECAFSNNSSTDGPLVAHISKGQDDVLASLKKGCSSSKKKVQRPDLCMLVDIINPYTL